MRRRAEGVPEKIDIQEMGVMGSTRGGVMGLGEYTVEVLGVGVWGEGVA